MEKSKKNQKKKKGGKVEEPLRLTGNLDDLLKIAITTPKKEDDEKGGKSGHK